MSKRWTYEEDWQLHQYGDIVSKDIGRTWQSCRARMSHLKSIGAWECLDLIDYLQTTHRRLTGDPLEADLLFSQQERSVRSKALIDEIFLIAKRHSDEWVRVEKERAFGPE